LQRLSNQELTQDLQAETSEEASEDVNSVAEAAALQRRPETSSKPDNAQMLEAEDGAETSSKTRQRTRCWKLRIVHRSVENNQTTHQMLEAQDGLQEALNALDTITEHQLRVRESHLAEIVAKAVA
jgi:hypothetical protein